MLTYYNENDPYAAQWLRNLILEGHLPRGDVDERSIVEVQPDDLWGYKQCHFFAGIGGWAYALNLAGWGEEPVWTGSCPCQPFSVAGAQKAQEDERHLWPIWFGLIRECRPSTIFGEQVSGAIAHGWLDDVYQGLEDEGYAVGAAVLPATSVGAPHKRDRLWFVANARGAGRGTGLLRQRSDDEQPFKQGRSVIAPEPGETSSPLAHTNNNKGSQGRITESRSECDFWKFEPAVGMRLDGLSRYLERFDMTQSHKLLSANGETEKRAREELLAMWHSDDAEAIWQTLRGHVGVSAQGVLFAYVRQLKNWIIDQTRIQPSGAEAFERQMRSVWGENFPPCPSHRSGQGKQPIFQYPDSLQALSRLLAYNAEKAWLAYCRENAVPRGWEEGINRVINNSPKRSHKLRAFGNAIVPQVAQAFIEAFMEVRP